MAERQGAPLVYKSETKPWVNTPGARLQFQTSSIPKQGPNKGRIVIDRIICHSQFNADVSVAVIKGQDLYRFPRLVTVKQRDGILRYNEVPGDAIRVFDYEAVGAAETKEHPDAAIANGQTITTSVLIPLAKPYMHTPEDTAMAAELLEYVEIGCASAAELTALGATVVLNSGNYWLLFECHEELDLVQHAVDTVQTQDFESTTSQEARLNVHGRLQDLLLFVRGASGGASLANLTSAGISQPQNMADTSMLANPDLKERYARSRKIVTGSFSTTGDPIRSDPFVGSTVRACAVLMSEFNSCHQQPEADTVVVKTVHTLGATLTAVMRIMKPRNDNTRKALAKRYGKQGAYRVKTKSKTKRDARMWPADQLAYMPIKIVA